MFINFDYLSPPITLYHSGKRTHTSNIGGFLTIVEIIAIVTSIVILLFTSYTRTSSLSFYKKYETDYNTFYFNESEIFHFFYLQSNINYGEKYDHNKYIRIFSYTNISFSYINQSSLIDTDHWLYDLCEDEIENKIEIENQYSESNISNYMCLKYYYNIDTNKYYTKNESGFKYPYINKLMNYNINVEKCVNDSHSIFYFNNSCANEKEINNYIKAHNEIFLYYNDHNVLQNNPKNPFFTTLSYTKFNLYPENNIFTEIYNINIAPLKIVTNEDIANKKQVKTKKQNNSYIKDSSNQKFILKENNYLLLKNVFELNKYSHIYKKHYALFFTDILPKIGGFIQLYHFIFYFLNYIYYKYKITLDIIDEISSMESKISENETKRHSINQLAFNKIGSSQKIVNKSKSRTSHVKQNLFQLSNITRDRYAFNSNVYNKKVDIGNNLNSLVKKNYKNSLSGKSLAEMEENSYSVCKFVSDSVTNSYISGINNEMSKKRKSNHKNYLPEFNYSKKNSCFSHCYSIKENIHEDDKDIPTYKGDKNMKVKREHQKRSLFSNYIENYIEKEEDGNLTYFDKYPQKKHSLCIKNKNNNLKLFSDKKNKRLSCGIKRPNNYHQKNVEIETKFISHPLISDYNLVLENVEVKKCDKKMLEDFNRKLSFCEFLSYYSRKGQYNNNMNIITEVRNKMISEEQMINGYINTINLSNYFKKVNTNSQY